MVNKLCKDLKVFDQMSKSQFMQTENDFLQLLMNVYIEKNKRYKNLLSHQGSFIEDQILEMRRILKAFKTEKELIPLPSSLHLHFKRTDFIVKMWTLKDLEYSYPEDYGYIREGDSFRAVINDESDDFVSVPKQILKGCYCKSVCENRCQCKRDEGRLGKCSRITCRSCKCFSDTQEEDIQLSSCYQEFLDNLSSASSSSASSAASSDLEIESDLDLNTDFDIEDHDNDILS